MRMCVCVRAACVFQHLQEGNCRTEARGTERHHGRDEETGAYDVSDDAVREDVIQERKTNGNTDDMLDRPRLLHTK